MTEEWYCNFHPFDGGRDWDDAVRFGFVAHGYGEAYVKPFSRLQVDDRVWVRLAKNKDSNAPTGFVGRGIVVTPPQPVATADIVVDGREESFVNLRGRMRGQYADRPGFEGEWVAGVRWEAVRSVDDRLTFDVVPFANRNTTVRFDTSRDDHAAFLETLERELPAPAGGARRAVVQEDEPLASDQAALELALHSGSATRQGYVVDPRAVELVGMTNVSDYFTSRGWTVHDVSQEKRGWTSRSPEVTSAGASRSRPVPARYRRCCSPRTSLRRRENTRTGSWLWSLAP